MFRERDFIERVFAFLTLESFRVKAGRWLAKRFKVGTFELQGDVIIAGTERKRSVALDSIKTWKVYPEMGFDIVTIELQDGTSFNWFDTYNDLIGILEARAAERRLAWQEE